MKYGNPQYFERQLSLFLCFEGKSKMAYKTATIPADAIQLSDFNKWIKMGIIKKLNVCDQNIKTDLLYWS